MNRYEYASSTQKRAFFQILALIVLLGSSWYITNLFDLHSSALVNIWIAVGICLVVVFGVLE